MKAAGYIQCNIAQEDNRYKKIIFSYCNASSQPLLLQVWMIPHMSSRWKKFYKIGFLKNFTKLIEKAPVP